MWFCGCVNRKMEIRLEICTVNTGYLDFCHFLYVVYMYMDTLSSDSYSRTLRLHFRFSVTLKPDCFANCEW